MPTRLTWRNAAPFLSQMWMQPLSRGVHLPSTCSGSSRARKCMGLSGEAQEPSHQPQQSDLIRRCEPKRSCNTCKVKHRVAACMVGWGVGCRAYIACRKVHTCFGEHAIPQQLEQEHPQDKWHCKCRFEHIRAGSDREQAHNLTGRR